MNTIKDSLKVIIISSVISLSAIFVFGQSGWFEPSAAPPGGNPPAPLTLDAQGGLTIPGNLKVGDKIEGDKLIIDDKIYAKDFFVNYLKAGTKVSKSITLYIDKDEDGYTPHQGDCDDNNQAINPKATPQYNSGIDYDCNGINEFTVDKTTYLHTWYAGHACTEGGQNGRLVDFKGYINGHTCTREEQLYDSRSRRYYKVCNSWSSDISTLYTMENKNSKHLLCLYDEPEEVVIGTSGNTGSCGGHSEQSYSISKNGNAQVRVGNTLTLVRATGAVWRIWCN